MSYPVKKTKADFEHNGVKYSADVVIKAEYDDYPIEGRFDYGDAEENARELARFERGELSSYIVTVTVSAFGVEARDVLGGVWVDFTVPMTMDDQIMETVNEHGVIETALDELVENLVSTAEALKPFMKAS